MLDSRQVVTSAAVVVVSGLLALGCSDTGPILIGAGDDVPASSLFENDLWVDGGGFSPNDRDVESFGVVWSCKAADSDGPEAADRSAVVWFVARDPLTLERSLFLSHYDGDRLTPPVQIVGEDQDERPGPTVQIEPPVAFPLGTGGYQGADAALTARVRANAGAWVVLFSARTWTRHPDDAITQAGAPGRVGRRRTLYSTVFVPGQRDAAEARVSGVIGGAGTSVVLRHGWRTPAVEVVHPMHRAGSAVDTVSDPASRAGAMPACDVTSFGLVSDGLAAQSDWGRQATSSPLQGPGSVFDASSYVRAHPSSGALGSAIYRAGEATSYLHLFYTQLLNSLGGGGSVARDVAAGYAAGGARMAGFTASFDLARLEWETPAELTPPAARNPGGTAPTSPGTGVYPAFHTYEQFVFYSYADASLIGGPGADPLGLVPAGAAYAYDNVGGHDGLALHPTAFHEELCATFAVQDDGDGTSSLIPGSHRDLATHTSAPGLHDLVNPSASNAGGPLDVAPNREIQGYPFLSRFVFGRDEGLSDTVVFYVGADNTRAGGIDAAQQSIVRQGLAVALDARGGLVAGSPTVWSRHRPSHHDRFLQGSPGSGPEDVKQDPLVAIGSANGGDGSSDALAGVPNDEGRIVLPFPPASGSAIFASPWFRTHMNRTGEWILLSYLQDEGTSLGFHRALKAVCYQAPRGGAAGPSLELRFSLPQELSATGGSVGIVQDPAAQVGGANAETQHRWDALPVSEQDFPSGLGYRGVQSEPYVTTVLWEQSDASGDRVFLRDLSVALGQSGTPGPLLLGAIVELEAGPQELVSAHRNDARDLFPFPKRSQFPLLDGAGRLGALGSRGLSMNELGPTGPAGAPSTLLVTFAKLIDGTTTDGDGADYEAVLQTYTRGAGLGSRLIVGTAVDEDQPVPAPVNAPGASQPFNASTSPVASYGQASLGIDTANPVFPVSVPPPEPDIAASPGWSPEAIYLVLTAPGRGTNGSTGTGLYARKIDLLRLRSGDAATFPAAITPSAGTSGPGSSGFAPPVRLDRPELDSAGPPALALHGRSLLALWFQDHHLWGQLTHDGLDWRQEGGAPDPFLVDPGSADTIQGFLFTCEQRGQVEDGLIVLFQYDLNGPAAAGADLRARVRTRLRFGP